MTKILLSWPAKGGALVLSMLAALSASAVSQAQGPGPGDPAPVASGDSLPIHDAQIEWIEVSNVSPLTEGVVERMELQVGMPAQKGKPIGYLYQKRAELVLKKMEIAAANRSAIDMAAAKKELAAAKVARIQRGIGKIADLYSQEQLDEAKAELKVAHEQENEAKEQQKIAVAERNLAQQAVNEYTIVAPFDGVIIERMKTVGESVQANEPVVRLGNLDRLRVFGYVPLKDSFRVQEGDVVEVIPNVPGVDVPFANKRFRGKITFVDPEIQPVGEKARRIFAEVDNPTHELKPGLNVDMLIRLGTGGANRNTAAIPAPPTR